MANMPGLRDMFRGEDARKAAEASRQRAEAQKQTEIAQRQRLEKEQELREEIRLKALNRAATDISQQEYETSEISSQMQEIAERKHGHIEEIRDEETATYGERVTWDSGGHGETRYDRHRGGWFYRYRASTIEATTSRQIGRGRISIRGNRIKNVDLSNQDDIDNALGEAYKNPKNEDKWGEGHDPNPEPEGWA